jgi:Fic family protein
MNSASFTENSAGRVVQTPDGSSAFVPSPLPPEITLTWELMHAVTTAERALGNLRGVGTTLPNANLLIQPFIRREAVLSSRIEGTEASIGDLVVFEAAGNVTPESSDVREVANYIAALEYGFARLGELPLSLRFIREVHERLMHGVRGTNRAPGEFRRLQNWIGASGSTMAEARYVPPPVAEMNEALDSFEKFLHASSDLPALLRLALIHYQFEAIHPFLDGNGRVGRLLLTFLLRIEGLLEEPLLYLSAYFEKNRSEYYDGLLDISHRGAWQEWIFYFLRAVEEQSNDAVARAKRIFALRDAYRTRVTTARSSALLHAIIDRLFDSPGVTIARMAKQLDITYPSAKNNVEKLVAFGILSPWGEAGRNRLYVANEILALVDAP